MRVFAFVIFLFFVFFQVVACERPQNNTENSPCRLLSAKLATIPLGYEAGDIFFSKDGFHVAVVLKKNGNAYMKVDATTSLPYQDVSRVTFLKGTRTYAFVAKKSDKECVVIDGKEGLYYDAVTAPQFTPDGRVVYAGKKADKWVIVSGTSVSLPFAAASDPFPFISQDGKRIAHEELDSTGTTSHLAVYDANLKLIIKGKEYDSLQSIRGDLSRSHLVYRVNKSSKAAVVVFDFNAPGCAEKVSLWYDDVLKYTLAPDGTQLTFIAIRDEQYIFVTNGMELSIPPLDMTLDIASSSNGNSFFTGVIKDHVVAYINGKDSGKYYDTIEYLSFSPDGLHSAFIASSKGKFFLVVDGIKGPILDKAVTPRFSPDSSTIVYRVRNNGKRYAVIADLSAKTLKENAVCDGVWDVSFSSDGKSVSYGAMNGQELWWKVEKL